MTSCKLERLEWSNTDVRNRQAPSYQHAHFLPFKNTNSLKTGSSPLIIISCFVYLFIVFARLFNKTQIASFPPPRPSALWWSNVSCAAVAKNTRSVWAVLAHLFGFASSSWRRMPCENVFMHGLDGNSLHICCLNLFHRLLDAPDWTLTVFRCSLCLRSGRCQV